MINNEIYDLATQAGLITFESLHDSMAVTPNIESVAKARKFAELIIKQCAKISSRAEKQCQHPGTEILKHFGVKE